MPSAFLTLSGLLAHVGDHAIKIDHPLVLIADPALPATRALT